MVDPVFQTFERQGNLIRSTIVCISIPVLVVVGCSEAVPDNGVYIEPTTVTRNRLLCVGKWYRRGRGRDSVLVSSR